jgi:hypothetical protein
MLSADLDSVTEANLEALVTGGVRESRSVEFKAALTIVSDSQKKEFLADVSSLANANGGDIVFGIDEADGVAANVIGLEGFDPDSDHLRVEEIIRNGIEPRIIGLRLHSIELASGRHALIVRVPNSLNRPHMVVFKGSSRFYSRNSAGKYPLDVHELRSAFIASESLSDRIRQFRIERIDAVLQGNTPEPLRGNHRICLHLIPLESFNPSFVFDLNRAQALRDKLRPIYASGWSPGTNYDGLLTSSRASQTESDSYVQLFRNGIIEAVEGRMLKTEGEPEQKIIPSIAYEREIIPALNGYRDFYKEYGMPTPIIIGLSLLNVRGFHMYVGPSRWNDSARLIDRDHLILPDRFAESYDFEAADFLRPCFDQIWNACGWSRDINYDDEGNWKPKH